MQSNNLFYFILCYDSFFCKKDSVYQNFLYHGSWFRHIAWHLKTSMVTARNLLTRKQESCIKLISTEELFNAVILPKAK